MEISSQNESEFKKLRCFLHSDEGHFLSQPRLMPCGNLACTSCIQKATIISQNNIKCKLCGSEHQNLNLENLKEADSIIDQIKCDGLLEEIEKNIENKIKLIEGKKVHINLINNINLIKNFKNEKTDSFEKKQEILEKIADQVKQDVSTRIKVIKDHLEKLQKDFLQTLESIQLNTQNALVAMNAEAKKALEKNDSISENIYKMLKDLDVNKKQLIKEIYDCQEYTYCLNELIEKFRIVMRKNIFEPSKWLPDEKYIYPYFDVFQLEIKPMQNK